MIHYGLIRARNDTAARAWLSIFGSMQRPEETLETEEIQSLVFNGFGRLPHGACIVAELSPDAARCQAWLREVVAGQQAEPLCFGELPIELPGRDAAAFVAFSAKGLRKLKTPPAHDADWLAAFPGVFNIGMAGRGRTLGDENHEDWRWSDARADCAIFVYGKDSKRRDEAREGHLALLRGHAGQKLAVIDTDPVTSNQKPGEISVEHFGFRDGISQPVISGTQRFAQGCCPRDVVEPGEFVFGYPNNLGYFAPSLTVPAEMDVAGSLPMPIADAEVGADSGTSSDFPDFDALDESYAPRDFGRNGTFLVVRQLAQDVEGFKKFTGKAAEKLRSTYPGLQGRNGGQVDAEWVAAKLVGRWQDGTPLVDLSRSQPGGPGGLPDNDFAFGADDPDGFGCPLGAHIRRSNPRDSLDPGDPLEQAITNRHRLMRRGRSYESGRGGTTEGLLESDKSETAEKGLLFVALCGDLERQFEFIQQTWIASPTFHGLVREPDPLVAQNKPSGSVYTIPRPSGPVVLRDLQSFVTVKAGGYFFLPSRSALRFLAMA